MDISSRQFRSRCLNLVVVNEAALARQDGNAVRTAYLRAQYLDERAGADEPLGELCVEVIAPWNHTKPKRRAKMGRGTISSAMPACWPAIYFFNAAYSTSPSSRWLVHLRGQIRRRC